MMWPITLPAGAIDAYAFHGNWPHWPVPASDLNGMLSRMDRLGMEKALLIPLAGVYSNVLEANQRLAADIARHQDRLIGIAAFDPRQSATPSQVLTRARDAGLRGLAVFPADHGYSLLHEALVDEALWVAQDFRWPAIIPTRLVMCWWLPVTPILDIVAAARKHPQVPIIAASCSYQELDQALRAMGELNNLYLETSGAQSLDAVPEMLQRAGASRILLGTGQPIQIPECNLVKLANPALAPADVDAILGGNARRLFGLQ